MNNYKTILKFLIKDMLKRREKKQKLIFVLLGIFYVFIAFSAVMAVIACSADFKAAGKSAELVTFILFIDFVLTIVFGTLSAISYLFMSKDTEFFKALPVKQSSVFMAKLTVVYLTEAVLSTAILVPALIVAGVFLQLPVLFYFIILLFIITVPVFALIFIALVSLPLMYLISLFKNRSFASSIALILIFSVVFGLYMTFMVSFNMNVSDSDLASYERLIGPATTISNIFYPVYMLVKFSALTSVYGLPLAAGLLVEAGIFLAALALMMVFAYWLCSLIYSNITCKLMENSGKRSGKSKKHVSTGAVKAFMKIEWRGVIRNPSVAMQVVSGVILCPLIVVVFSMMFVNMGNMFATEEIGVAFDLSAVVWIMSIMSIMMFGIGANAGPSTCISREGKSINLLKGLPLSAETIIKAKRWTYVLISSASIITGFAAMVTIMIMYDALVWWIPVGGLPMILIWLWAMTNLSIYMDLRGPKLDWKSYREIIKRGKNNLFSIVWMFFSMFLGFGLFMFVVMGIVADAMFVIAMGFIILSGLGLIAAVIFQRLLDKNASKLFKRINA